MDEEEAFPVGSSGRGDDPTGRASGEQTLEGIHSDAPTPTDGDGSALVETTSTSNSPSIVGDSSLLGMADQPAPLVQQYSSTGPTSGRPRAPDGQPSNDLSVVIGEVLDLLENCDDHPVA